VDWTPDLILRWWTALLSAQCCSSAQRTLEFSPLLGATNLLKKLNSYGTGDQPVSTVVE